MATSSVVADGDLATAVQYNALRTDILTTHIHDGTNGNAAIGGAVGVGMTAVRCQDNALLLDNPAGTYAYTITAGAIAAARVLHLPVIAGTDTLASLGLAQTFTAAQTFTGGIITSGGTNDIHLQTDEQRLKGGGGDNDSIMWTGGDMYLQTRQHMYFSVDGGAAHAAGSDKFYFETGGIDGAGATIAYLDDGGGFTLYTNTAVPGTVSGAATLYTVGSGGSAELTVKDGSGNTTTLSPHNDATGEWLFNSKNHHTGRVLRVHMERLVKFVDEQFGTDFVEDFFEEADE